MSYSVVVELYKYTAVDPGPPGSKALARKGIRPCEIQIWSTVMKTILNV